MSFAELQANVNRGTSWLDENRPGWRDLIDTEKLDLGSLDDCIMGQLGMLDDHSITWMREHGFWALADMFYWSVEGRGCREDCQCEQWDIYDVLTDMWLYELSHQSSTQSQS